MSRLHFDILTKEQKDTLASLKPFSRYGGLGGGTALALQLAHRRSYDFDVLCPEPIPKSFIKMCQNTPQLCWGDEWPTLSPGGRGLG